GAHAHLPLAPARQPTPLHGLPGQRGAQFFHRGRHQFRCRDAGGEVEVYSGSAARQVFSAGTFLRLAFADFFFPGSFSKGFQAPTVPVHQLYSGAVVPGENQWRGHRRIARPATCLGGPALRHRGCHVEMVEQENYHTRGLGAGVAPRPQSRSKKSEGEYGKASQKSKGKTQKAKVKRQKRTLSIIAVLRVALPFAL